MIEVAGIWHCECGQSPCTGLDCGVYLPGRAPRKVMAAKPADETARIRSAAWATRRARYGQAGHAGSYSRLAVRSALKENDRGE